MSGQQDDFSDLGDHELVGGGSLGGDAFKDFDRVVEKLNPGTGCVDFTCTCTHCNRKVRISIPVLSELVPASQGITPRNEHDGQAWVVHQGVMYPAVNCPCGQMIQSITITPDRAHRLIGSMIRARGVSEPQVVARITEVRRLAGIR